MDEEQYVEASDRVSTANPYLIPVSVVIAGALIAGALYFGDGDTPAPTRSDSGQPVSATDAVREVTGDDHIKGPADAKVIVVEYSDFECPFCKGFHETMNQIMGEYGDSGDVAWVYRHFPLDQLHPVKARAEAVASECAAEQGGNDAFWKFADRFFELTPSNNRTAIETVIPQIVREIGLDTGAFDACMNAGAHDERIESDVANAIETGGRGTPWSIVIMPNGETVPINGAQPYAVVKQLIEAAL